MSLSPQTCLALTPWIWVLGCGATSPASSSVSYSEPDAGSTTVLAPATELAPQDVTILYPYPSKLELNNLLTAASAGTEGDILPEEVFAKLPSLVNHLVKVSNSRAEAYVVAARANCAYDTVLKDRPCRGQLQLIFQMTGAGALPGSGGQNSSTIAFADASIHAVYPLDDADFLTLVRELLELRNAQGGYEAQTLSVHPIMKKQGLGGAFAKGLNTIISKYAGPKTLHKVTFITIEQPTPNARGGEVWKFGAVEKKDGVYEPLSIPSFTTPTTEQTLVSIGPAAQVPESDFDVHVTPVLPAAGDISGLVGRGAIAASNQTVAEASYDTALALENPLLRSAADSDCIGCHVTHIRKRAENHLALKPEGRTNHYVEGSLLQGASVRSQNGVRALGWSAFATRPKDADPSEGGARAVSQRVINETVYTLSQMNRMLK